MHDTQPYNVAPCHESWKAMPLVEHERHCATYSHKVIDRTGAVKHVLYIALLLSLSSALWLVSAEPGNAEKRPAGDISVVLAIDESFRVGQPVNTTFLLLNSTDHDIYALKWHTPFEGIRNKIFKTSRDGIEVAYQGIMADRGDPDRKSYVLIESHSAKFVVVNLAETYDFSKAGEYRIEYTQGRLFDMSLDEKLLPRKIEEFQEQPIKRHVVTVKITGEQKGDPRIR